MLSSIKKSIQSTSHSENDSVGAGFNNRVNKRGICEDDSLPESSSFCCSNIYIVCPAYVETGGPEALHQLCDMINFVLKSSDRSKSSSTLGGVQSCFMLYLVENSKTSSLAWASSIQECYSSNYEEAYKHIRIATEEPYRPTDLIIWPECWTKYIDMYHTSRQSCRTAVWWLSVDNNKKQFQSFDTRLDLIHLYQSEYAHHYLRRKCNSAISSRSDTDINKKLTAMIHKMTEYIPSHRYPKHQTVDERSNHGQNNDRPYDVLYNPAKGMHYTDSIIQYFLERKQTDVTFTPIAAVDESNTKSRRLTPTEVTNMLLKAKVYIDFGPHPGMDRLPREAALCGCCVITNRQGAAAFHKDVPIPSKFKIDVRENDIYASQYLDETFAVIKECANSYDSMCGNFDDYRTWIRKQKDEMQRCVETFLSEINSRRATMDCKEQKKVKAGELIIAAHKVHID